MDDKWEELVTFICESTEIDNLIGDMYLNWKGYWSRPIHEKGDMKNHFVLESLEYFSLNWERLKLKEMTVLKKLCYGIIWNQFRSKGSRFAKLYKGTKPLIGDLVDIREPEKLEFPNEKMILQALERRKCDFKNWIIGNEVFIQFYIMRRKYKDISLEYGLSVRTLITYNRKTIKYLKEYFGKYN
jgi:hypothetical protein